MNGKRARQIRKIAVASAKMHKLPKEKWRMFYRVLKKRFTRHKISLVQ